MSFFKLEPKDIVNVKINTFPSFTVNMYDTAVTGSVYLDKQYLNDDLENRLMYGFSRRLGGYVSASNPLSSSVTLLDAESGTTTNITYESILELYKYHSFFNPKTYSTGSAPVSLFRVINVPSIYYDRAILSGSLTASDWDGTGTKRTIYDDGMGGLYHTGVLVGTLFASEGLACIYDPGLTDFGSVSSVNDKWSVSFKGTHTIPTKIFMCRAPSGQLNATSNPTFYHTPEDGKHKNEREIVLSGSDRNVWITKIGLYNSRYELVGVAHLAQPVRKDYEKSILYRLRLDF